jgi:hypothetical protein
MQARNRVYAPTCSEVLARLPLSPRQLNHWLSIFHRLFRSRTICFGSFSAHDMRFSAMSEGNNPRFGGAYRKGTLFMHSR